MAQSSGLSDPRLSTEANPNSWKQFTSKEGRFSILFPGSPTTSEQSIDVPGWTFVLRKIQLRVVAEYGVMYADYPKSLTDSKPADVILDDGARGAVAEVNSELLSIKSISVDGYPGRFLKERMPDGTIMHAKMILAGQRMYQVAITTPREDGADSQTVTMYGWITSKFLDSFEIINSQTAESQNASASVKSCPPDISNCVYVDGPLNSRAASLPRPPFPPIARASGASGLVEVLVVVDERGSVISATSISGDPLLQPVSVQAARYAKFTPQRVNDKPVRFSGVIQYNFVLDH
jgi:TonB family protein